MAYLIYKKVVSKIIVRDKRGNINIGDKGETTSILPHSNGLFPVWFKKHEREFYWYPLFMKPEDIEFITKPN